MLHGITPKFGWRKQNPPQKSAYYFPLKAGDVRQNGWPSQALVNRLLPQLLRDGDTTKPGFILIPNAKKVLGSWKRMHAFQHNLVKALARAMQISHPQLFRAWHSEDQALIERKGIPTYAAPVDGYHEAQNFERTQKTPKEVHFDMWTNLASLGYGPFRNIRGGIPMVADARQYQTDYDLKISDFIGRAGSRSGWVLDEHYPVIRKNYALRLDVDPAEGPILIFNNHKRSGGVLHGATEPSKVDGEQPARRPLYYVSCLNAGIRGSEKRLFFTRKCR